MNEAPAGAPAFARLSAARTREFGGLGASPYMNAASWGVLPSRAVAASNELVERRAGGPVVRDRELMETLARARDASAAMIGADPGDVLLCPNTSFGINLAVAAAEATGPPGVVVLSDGEFPANVFPWLALERRGFTVHRIPTVGPGWPDEAALLEAIAAPNVRALAISAVQFASGYRADLRTLGARCREHGVLFAVDAIQELGAGPLDVKNAGVDVLSCGAQKWLCGPWGSGFAYVAEHLHQRFDPPMVSWLSFTGAANFEDMLQYRYEFQGDARKFELATLGMQDYAGMTASMELFLQVGLETIRAYLLALTQPIVDWAESHHEVELVSPPDREKRAGIVSVRPPDPEACARALRDVGVICVVREGAVRLSPHWYNTADQVDLALRVLSEGS